MFSCVNRVSELWKNLCVCAHTLTLASTCVFVEVVADDTPAVQAVLKADTRRLRLLEEEKRLQARLDKGEDSVSEELEKVCICLPGLFSGNHIIFVTVSQINKSINAFINLLEPVFITGSGVFRRSNSFVWWHCPGNGNFLQIPFNI